LIIFAVKKFSRFGIIILQILKEFENLGLEIAIIFRDPQRKIKEKYSKNKKNIIEKMNQKYYYGLQVYAKVEGHPYWPARIDPIELSRNPNKQQNDKPKRNGTEIW